MQAMNNTQFFWFNGECVKPADLASDRGLSFGDGVFETIAYFQSSIPFLALHLERLNSSCARLKINLNLDNLRQQLQTFLAEVDASYGRLKIIVSRGKKGVGCYPDLQDEANIYFAFTPTKELFSNRARQLDLRVARTPLYDMPVLAGLKHLNRLNYIAAALEETSPFEEELLFLDVRQNVIETMHGNVFFIRAANRQLYTPCLKQVGVVGVLRTFIQNTLAEQCQFKVVEQDVSVAALDDFDGAFMCNAIKGIVPIGKIKHQSSTIQFDDEQYGMMFQNKLQQYLAETV
ncbi:Aminodeoxychorismate lyase [Thalassocella blandensis]|nr:Aminodeoxychorismate lyase [Thalassocella blandensis]